MSLFGLFRAATIAVPAVLAGGSVVAQQVVSLPPGTVLVVLPGTTNAAKVETVPMQPAAFERIFQQQRAIMARMIADMDAMFGTFPGMTAPMIDVAGGKGALICEQSISVTYNGHDAKPLVRVSRAGNGCGPSAGGAIPAQVVPSAPQPKNPRVLEVNEPVPAIVPPVRHRT